MLTQRGNFRTAIARAAAVLMAAIGSTFPTTARATPAPPAADLLSGTVITDRNWEQYRAFMSDGLIALFEGNHFWHIPAGVTLVVGPTISIPLPKKSSRIPPAILTE